jgi:tetratricopeptide (TPR) repeat protein
MSLYADPARVSTKHRYICNVVREVDPDPDAESLLRTYSQFNVSIDCSRAERYQATDQFDQAVLALNEALRCCETSTVNPGRAYLFYWRGNCQLEKGDFAAAIADYDAALALGYTGYADCVLSQRAVAVRRRQESQGQEQKPEPG